MEGNTENAGRRRVSRWRVAAWTIPGIVLLVPLAAMQFTDEVNWTVFDFALMAALMIGVGVAYELAVRMTSNFAYRAAVGVALAATFLLIWVNGAVGIIGDGPVNLLYVGVLVVGFFGALLAQFQPHGMARALVAMALVQMLIPGIALVIWKAGWHDLLIDPNSPHPPFDPGVAHVFALNAVFATLFVGSALLFRQAARGWSERGAA
jgi:hypothetical protein